MAADDFCAGRVRLGATANELATVRKSSIRRFGGYDYQSLDSDFYLSADGKTVTAIQAPISALCSYAQRFGALPVQPSVTRSQVKQAFGDPTVAADDDEFWFYSDKDQGQYVVFHFRDNVALGGKVQVIQADEAKRQFYPLLGAVEGPAPVKREDAALGPLIIGMDPEAALNSLDGRPSEGELRPYTKLIFRDLKVEVHYSGTVKAIYNEGDAALKTPRGVGLGQRANTIQEAYGEPRIAKGSSGEEEWSYESLRDGVGLVFSIKDGVVSAITVVSADYQFRPEVQ